MAKRAPANLESIESIAPNLVLTRRQLHELGVSERMIGSRVRANGPWQRLLPGVIMLRNGTPTVRQSIDSALRYAGPTAIVTGVAGCRLHGLQRIPKSTAVHLLLPDDRKRQSAGHVLIERTSRLPTVVQRDGFPVAEVTRAALDAARRMKRRDEAEALLSEAVQRGLTTPTRLRSELEDGSDRGSSLPRSVLAELVSGAHSPAELWGVRVAARSGLPKPQLNVRLFTRDGIALPKPDAWFDEVAMAWEIDSYDWHLAPADYARTLQRHAVLTAAGVVVLHTLPSRLRTEPDAVIAELRAAYHQASLRPRPDIVVK